MGGLALVRCKVLAPMLSINIMQLDNLMFPVNKLSVRSSFLRVALSLLSILLILFRHCLRILRATVETCAYITTFQSRHQSQLLLRRANVDFPTEPCCQTPMNGTSTSHARALMDQQLSVARLRVEIHPGATSYKDTHKTNVCQTGCAKTD